jgi:hypothetical protein
MTAATGDGDYYAFIVFLIGFILGTVRVLLIEAGATQPCRDSDGNTSRLLGFS